MIAGSYDPLAVHKKSAPCPNDSVLSVQSDHGDNGPFVLIRQMRDGVL
jgi:hypothetical protein